MSTDVHRLYSEYMNPWGREGDLGTHENGTGVAYVSISTHKKGNQIYENCEQKISEYLDFDENKYTDLCKKCDEIREYKNKIDKDLKECNEQKTIILHLYEVKIKKFLEHCAAKSNCSSHVSGEQQNDKIISETEENYEQNIECKDIKKGEDRPQSVFYPKTSESISLQSTGPLEKGKDRAHKNEPEREIGRTHAQSYVMPSENRDGSHSEFSEPTINHYSNTTHQVETKEKLLSCEYPLKSHVFDSIQSCPSEGGSDKLSHTGANILNTQRDQTETPSGQTLGGGHLGEEATLPQIPDRNDIDNEAIYTEISGGLSSTEKDLANQTDVRDNNSVSTNDADTLRNTVVRSSDVTSHDVTANDRKSASGSGVIVDEDQASSDASYTTIRNGDDETPVHTNEGNGISTNPPQIETRNEQGKQKEKIEQRSERSNESPQTDGASEENPNEPSLQKDQPQENSLVDPGSNSETIGAKINTDNSCGTNESWTVRCSDIPEISNELGRTTPGLVARIPNREDQEISVRTYIIIVLVPLIILLLLILLIKFTPMGIHFTKKKRKKRKEMNEKLQRILLEPSIATEKRVHLVYNSFETYK